VSVTTVEPPFASWPDILRENQSRVSALSELVGDQCVSVLRQEVLEQARQYTLELSEIARAAQIALRPRATTLPALSGAPLVMAGHQPVLYHPGLLFKANMLSRFSRDIGARAVHVVIDTDEGDAGVLTWPRITGGSLEIRRQSIAAAKSEGVGLYQFQKLASADVIRETFAELISDLRRCGLPYNGDDLESIAAAYERLAGHPVARAHSIVRAMREERCYDEVPLTRLLANTHMQTLVMQLVDDGSRLATIYNTTLDAYRIEHGIENAANPFPNMKSGSEGHELPLWCLTGTTRKPLYTSTPRGECQLISPRGSLTTFVLRAYCSDLFIHGLGGGRYDQFVDAFAERYLGLPLPRFVVVSETRHLFPEHVAHITREIELASQLKEMIARTEQYLGKGIFTADEEQQLQAAIDQRLQLRVAIQNVRNGDEKSAISHQLNAANKLVRSLIEEGSLRPVLSRFAANQAALSRWSFREFPFFLFPSSRWKCPI
jgi:hypothetical protein